MSDTASPDLPPSFEPTSLSPDAIAEALGSTEWGQGLSPADLATLAGFFRSYRATHRATLFSEGESGTFMAVLVSGVLRVYKRDFYGEERALSSVEPGSTFGEMSFLDAQPRSASLRVAEEAAILVLTRSGWQAIVDQNPRLAVSLLQQMVRTLSGRLRRLSDLSVQHLI